MLSTPSIRSFCFAVFFITSAPAWSSNSADYCWDEAAARYGVDPWLLYAIAQVESNIDPNALNHNDDTYDIGLMQINSWWFPKLKPFGITPEDLYDPCTNINIGAWILAHSFLSFGDTWESVGAYNAGTAKSPEQKKKREYYAQKVKIQYQANKARFSSP